MFLDQAYRLLRAHCVNCHRFRLARVEIHLYCCRLRLIRYGLLKEAAEVEDIVPKSRHQRGLQGDTQEDGINSDSSDGDGVPAISLRETFVKRAIHKSFKGRRPRSDLVIQNEALCEARKDVIREFQKDILRLRKCANCKM